MDLRSALGRTLAIAILFSGAVSFGAETANSPNDRQPTDPKSINSDSSPSARPIAIDDLFYSRRVTSPAWSPDGKEIAFSTNFTGRMNLWKVSSDSGWPLQLTVSDDRQFGAVWSPDGKWIVYEQDFGGSEYYDLFAVLSTGGAPINLTNTPDISESNAQFSPDGKMLALSYKPKTSPVTDIALMDWNSRQIRNITNEKTKDHLWQLDVWTRDGKYLIASRMNAGFDDSSIYRIDVASGQTEELTPHQGKTLFFAGGVSPDGKTIVVTSNQKGGYQNVALLDVASKQLKWITDTQWEAQGGEFSPNGKLVTWVLNADGVTTTNLYNVSSGKSEAIAMPQGLTSPDGTPSAFSPDGKYLLLGFQNSQRPSDFWVYDVELAGHARSRIPPWLD